MSHLSLQATAPAHHDVPVTSRVTTQRLEQTATASMGTLICSMSTVVLSFAFDSLQKTLNVVVKDELSGEVLRKMEYTHIPHNIHHREKLNGLLLDQIV